MYKYGHVNAYQVEESRPVLDVKKLWCQQSVELGVKLGVLQVMIL